MAHSGRTINSNHAISSLRAARPLITRGQALTLLIDGANSRIVLPVISLESGGPGEAIKVASPDRKRIYPAEIVNSTTVRSKF